MARDRAMRPWLPRGLLLVWVILLFQSVTGVSAGGALAQSPPSPPGCCGAYQEPAPQAQQEKHAVQFVNTILKKNGARARVTAVGLRNGVVLRLRPSATSPSSTAPNRVSPPAARTRAHPARRSRSPVAPSPRAPQSDLGPAERAGVAAPTDQQLPGSLLGLIASGVLAGIGLALQAVGRFRGSSGETGR